MSKKLYRSVSLFILVVSLSVAPASMALAGPTFLGPVDAPQALDEVADQGADTGWLEVVLDRLASLFGIDFDLDASTGDGSCPEGGTEHGPGMDTGG